MHSEITSGLTEPTTTESPRELLTKIFSTYPSVELMVREGRALNFEINAYRKRTLEGRLRMGELLDQIFHIVPHGQFEIVVIEGLGLAKQTAWAWRSRYLREKGTRKVPFETFARVATQPDGGAVSNCSEVEPIDPTDAPAETAHSEELQKLEAQRARKNAVRATKEARTVRCSFVATDESEAADLKGELSRVKPTAKQLLKWLRGGCQ